MHIDSHLHFWKHEPGKRAWIKDEMTFLQKDYLPEDIAPALQQSGIEGCVAVQSLNDESDNDFLLQLAGVHPVVKGIVGWTDLQANDLEQKLVEFRRNPLIKGFRHIIEAEDSILLKPVFKSGVEQLSRNGFTFDILANTEQLRYAYQLASQLLNQKFVIDHAGKPPISKDGIADWKRNISLFGPLQNVFCKIPGINMEMTNGEVSAETIRPYLDVTVDTFKTDRLMYGSNWPVCLPKADYEKVWNLTENYFREFSTDEKEAVFGKTASLFYKL